LRGFLPPLPVGPDRRRSLLEVRSRLPGSLVEGVHLLDHLLPLTLFLHLEEKFELGIEVLLGKTQSLLASTSSLRATSGLRPVVISTLTELIHNQAQGVSPASLQRRRKGPSAFCEGCFGALLDAAILLTLHNLDARERGRPLLSLALLLSRVAMLAHFLYLVPDFLFIFLDDGNLREGLHLVVEHLHRFFLGDEVLDGESIDRVVVLVGSQEELVLLRTFVFQILSFLLPQQGAFDLELYDSLALPVLVVLNHFHVAAGLLQLHFQSIDGLEALGSSLVVVLIEPAFFVFVLDFFLFSC